MQKNSITRQTALKSYLKENGINIEYGGLTGCGTVMSYALGIENSLIRLEEIIPERLFEKT